MPEVTVQKVKDPANQTAPIFADIAKRFDAVRQRAYELFENRGGEGSRALDDWFNAEREVFGWSAAELAEKDNAYEIDFTLAGFDPKDVQVTATPGEVIACGATLQQNKVEKDKVLWSEFGSKDVCRRIELPGPIDTDKVTATLDKGVLHIKAPKAAEGKDRNIRVATTA